MTTNISFRSAGLPTFCDCSQFDRGRVARFTVDTDLTGKQARYAIANPHTEKTVTAWATVEDAHTISFPIPVQISDTPGTYDAQILIYSPDDIADDLLAWKAQVLAGQTSILIKGEGASGSVTTEVPLTSVASFSFKIRVFPSVSGIGTMYEGGQTAFERETTAALEDVQTALSAKLSKSEAAQTYALKADAAKPWQISPAGEGAAVIPQGGFAELEYRCKKSTGGASYAYIEIKDVRNGGEIWHRETNLGASSVMKLRLFDKDRGDASESHWLEIAVDGAREALIELTAEQYSAIPAGYVQLTTTPGEVIWR